MSIKLPSAVVKFLLGLGTALLAVSVYLEETQLGLLQAHPILVNLMSGATGFCFGIVALSAVVSRYVERFELAQQWSAVAGVAKRIRGTVEGLDRDNKLPDWQRWWLLCILHMPTTPDPKEFDTYIRDMERRLEHPPKKLVSRLVKGKVEAAVLTGEPEAIIRALEGIGAEAFACLGFIDRERVDKASLDQLLAQGRTIS
jgi:hypothetical protein